MAAVSSDPSLYPFLEKLKVNNRVTLHILESLQYILVEGVAGKERRRVSLKLSMSSKLAMSTRDSWTIRFARPRNRFSALLERSPTTELPISVRSGENQGRKIPLKFLKGEKVGEEKATKKLFTDWSTILSKLASVPHAAVIKPYWTKRCPGQTLSERTRSDAIRSTFPEVAMSRIATSGAAPVPITRRDSLPKRWSSTCQPPLSSKEWRKVFLKSSE